MEKYCFLYISALLLSLIAYWEKSKIHPVLLRAERVHYFILLTEANDQCFIGYTSDSAMVDISLANYYKDMQQTDYAIYYYNRCLGQKENKYIIIGKAYSKLPHIFLKKGNYQDAYTYLSAYSANSDSLTRKEILKNQNLMQALISKFQVEKENDRLKGKSSFERLFTILLVLVLLATLLTFYFYIQKRKARNRERSCLLKQLLQNMQQNSISQMSVNDVRIEELNKRLSSLHIGNTSSELDIIILNLEKTYLERENEHINVTNEKQKTLNECLEVSDIYIHFRHLSQEGSKATGDDFYKLEQILDETHPHFCLSLKQLYPPISTKEYRVCMLVKIGMNPSAMACLLSSSNSGISMIRQRLNEKVFQEKGKSDDFDRKIRMI
ncbi:MAG: hypothetical protein GX416_14520 [Bacteroidales bacterium]|nr:hypothetical protein [Bacteroidales bacterium]